MKGLLKSLVIFTSLVCSMSCLTADLGSEEETSSKITDFITADDTASDQYASLGIYEDKTEDGHDFSMPTYTDGIAAIVNNDIITMERVRMDVGPIIKRIQSESRNEQEFRRNLFNAEMDVINSTINRKLIVEAFMAKGGQISETYEKKEYENYLQHVFGGNRLEFAKFLKEYGKSRREFKIDVKERAIINFMMSELRASQQEVSPMKIKEYYDSHISEFFKPHEVELKQIVVFDDDPDAQRKLADIKHALANKDDFETIARKYSDAFLNFDLGYISPDDLVPEVAETVKNMQLGEHSEPLALSGATYIFSIAGERPAHQQTLQEASRDIENLLFYKYQEEARTNWIKSLRDKAYIKIFLQE